MEVCGHVEFRDPVNSLCISGGTHGNELTGVYLVKNWLKSGAREVQRNSFRTHAVLTNLRATERCVRFTDVDLNRQITQENLFLPIEENICPYEIQRARELYSQFQNEAGEKGIDFWLDLHNTTSNTGPFFITSRPRGPFALHLAAHMQMKFPELRVMILKDGHFEGCHFEGDQQRNEKEDHTSKFPTEGVPDLGKEGFGLEMGPLAHGTLNASMFNLAKKIVCGVLDLVEEFNNGNSEFEEKEIEVFRFLGVIHYPTDEKGEITAMISPELDGNDWKPLHPGDPLFLSFAGETIPYKGNDVVWPVFINEAAYLHNNIAMAVNAKEKITVPALKLQGNQT